MGANAKKKPEPAVDMDLFWCRHCGTPFLPCAHPCTTCGGNVARAERLKLTLGTRLRYLGAAPRVSDDSFVGVHMLTELYRRFWPGRPPKALREWYSRESCYSLDAPEVMPAGACQWVDVPDAADDDDWPGGYPAQITVRREPGEGGNP